MPRRERALCKHSLAWLVWQMAGSGAKGNLTGIMETAVYNALHCFFCPFLAYFQLQNKLSVKPRASMFKRTNTDNINLGWNTTRHTGSKTYEVCGWGATMLLEPKREASSVWPGVWRSKWLSVCVSPSTPSHSYHSTRSLRGQADL